MKARAFALGVWIVSRAVLADELTAPPMVPAPVEAERVPRADVPPPPPPPPTENAVTPTVPRVSNRLIDPVEGDDDESEPGALRLMRAPEEAPGRMKRVGLSLALGAASGATLGLIGGLIGASLGPGQLQPMGNGWSLAALGFCLGAPVGVLISGWLFEGNGTWWATLLGDAAGALISLAAIGFGGPDGGAAFFTLPLVGSVLGYELTSDASRATVTPVVSLLPRGGALSLMGRF